VGEKLVQQLNIELKTKEEEAIEFIKKHEPPEGYFLGFSGGKDSVVLYDLTRKSGVKFQAYYSATGIDAPELVKFINENYLDVVHLRPKKSFFYYIVNTGYAFPTIFHRWCCDVLKKRPAQKIPLKFRLMGIRAEESAKRAGRKRIQWVKSIRAYHYKPIFYWLEWEVWDYIEKNNLKYCSLYDEGFSRLGCVVCPFVSGKKAAIQKARWPKIYHAFELAMNKVYNNGRFKDGRAWEEKTFEEFLNNWYNNIPISLKQSKKIDLETK